MAEVPLVDLEVIVRYSLAIRQERAPAEEVLAALDESRALVMALLEGRSTNGDGEPDEGAGEPRLAGAPPVPEDHEDPQDHGDHRDLDLGEAEREPLEEAVSLDDEVMGAEDQVALDDLAGSGADVDGTPGLDPEPAPARSASADEAGTEKVGRLRRRGRRAERRAGPQEQGFERADPGGGPGSEQPAAAGGPPPERSDPVEATFAPPGGRPSEPLEVPGGPPPERPERARGRASERAERAIGTAPARPRRGGGTASGRPDRAREDPPRSVAGGRDAGQAPAAAQPDDEDQEWVDEVERIRQRRMRKARQEAEDRQARQAELSQRARRARQGQDPGYDEDEQQDRGARRSTARAADDVADLPQPLPADEAARRRAERRSRRSRT